MTIPQPKSITPHLLAGVIAGILGGKACVYLDVVNQPAMVIIAMATIILYVLITYTISILLHWTRVITH